MKMRRRIMLEGPAVAPLIRLDEVTDGFFCQSCGEDVAVDEDGQGGIGTVSVGFAVVDFRLLGSW